jgi:ribonuclease J
MCDSTNAERPGFTMSEKTVGKTFDEIFADNKNHRIIIATFASNVDRVQQIINTAYKNGRKVVVEGRSMVNIIGIASELGYISIPDNTLIDIEELKRYPDRHHHDGKPGRGDGSTVPHGKRRAQESDDQAERYDRS